RVTKGRCSRSWIRTLGCTTVSSSLRVSSASSEELVVFLSSISIRLRIVRGKSFTRPRCGGKSVRCIPVFGCESLRPPRLRRALSPNCAVSHEIELTINDIAFGGKGVGRLGGKAVFVPFVIDDERIAARVLREKKSFAEAEIVRLIDASPHRATPCCP